MTTPCHETVNDKLIWSADVPDETALMRYLDMMPQLRVIKLDRLFLEGTDLTTVDRVQDLGLLVFDDAKIYEIPSKSEGIAKKHLKRKPWMLNCMAGICSNGVMEAPTADERDGLKRFADACHAVGTKPCGVTVLTTKTPEMAEREFSKRVIDQVRLYAQLMLEAGFTDMVCSPQEVEIIRSMREFDELDLNTPGVRPAGSATNDQARVDTPAGALSKGATRLVIGRPLTQGNPTENFRNITAEMATAT